MIIAQNLTGATSYTQRFECSAQKLGIKANGVLKTDIENAYITILLVDSQGQQKVITPRTRLGDLMEIAASNTGMTQIKQNYSSGSIASYDYMGTIELSNYGSVDLSGGYGQIQLDNCVSTSTFNLFGIDSQKLTKMIIDYRPLWSAANQYKETDINAAYAIAIPVSNLVELQLQYINGRTVIYKPDELKLICQEINEIAEVIQNIDNKGATDVVVGFKNLFCIGVTDCVSMRVQYTADSTFYKISDTILQ